MPGGQAGEASAGGLPSLADAGVEDADGRVDVIVAVVRHGPQTEAGRVGGDRGLLDEMRDHTGTGDETGGRTAGGGIADEDRHDTK